VAPKSTTPTCPKQPNQPDYIVYSRKNLSKIENTMCQSPVVKLAVAELIKTLGNKSFNEKDFERAIDYYLNTICIYRYFCPQRNQIVDESTLSYETPSQAHDARSLINVAFLNLTACYLTLKEFDKALLSIEESLKLDDQNDKAWFRKAKALEGTNELNNLPLAIDCLELAVKHSKTTKDEAYFRRLLQEMNDKYVDFKSEQRGLGNIEASPKSSKHDSKSHGLSDTGTTTQAGLGGGSPQNPPLPSK
jgi:tetratricopeptide (TPR) repeat protein